MSFHVVGKYNDSWISIWIVTIMMWKLYYNDFRRMKRWITIVIYITFFISRIITGLHITMLV